MADLVIGVVGDVLRHVSIELLKRVYVSRVSSIRVVIVVDRSAELVVLLPQIGLDKFDCRGKSENGSISLGKPLVVTGE